MYATQNTTTKKRRINIETFTMLSTTNREKNTTMVKTFLIDIVRQRRAHNPESPKCSLMLFQETKETQNQPEFAFLQCDCNWGHLDKVDQLDYRTVTIHSKKAGYPPIGSLLRSRFQGHHPTPLCGGALCDEPKNGCEGD